MFDTMLHLCDSVYRSPLYQTSMFRLKAFLRTGVRFVYKPLPTINHYQPFITQYCPVLEGITVINHSL